MLKKNADPKAIPSGRRINVLKKYDRAQEAAMTQREMLLPEFEKESANTRRMLERIPDEALGWKPLESSWSLAELATHIAFLPQWGVFSIEKDSFDVVKDGAAVRRQAACSGAELLKGFDETAAAFRAALAGAGDELLAKPWTLLKGGEPIFTMPRLQMLRLFLMNHLVHHRGQLCMYFRLKGIPVPAIYGPSADES